MLGTSYQAISYAQIELLALPYVDFDLPWEHDRNNYNKKIIVGAGVKAHYPLKNGALFAGVKVQADQRVNKQDNRSVAGCFSVK